MILRKYGQPIKIDTMEFAARLFSRPPASCKSVLLYWQHEAIACRKIFNWDFNGDMDGYSSRNRDIRTFEIASYTILRTHVLVKKAVYEHNAERVRKYQYMLIGAVHNRNEYIHDVDVNIGYRRIQLHQPHQELDALLHLTEFQKSGHFLIEKERALRRLDSTHNNIKNHINLTPLWEPFVTPSCSPRFVDFQISGLFSNASISYFFLIFFCTSTINRTSSISSTSRTSHIPAIRFTAVLSRNAPSAASSSVETGKAWKDALYPPLPAGATCQKWKRGYP